MSTSLRNTPEDALFSSAFHEHGIVSPQELSQIISCRTVILIWLLLHVYCRIPWEFPDDYGKISSALGLFRCFGVSVGGTSARCCPRHEGNFSVTNLSKECSKTNSHKLNSCNALGPNAVLWQALQSGILEGVKTDLWFVSAKLIRMGQNISRNVLVGWKRHKHV